ncbi:MAG: large-conductance mechanosensitive channel protein MscL [Flavobacteriaceae bacterium]|nr:large-conductance mechanosensitive channel protein MscL [Flavobacteriaceae bacterium]
MSFIKEFKEFAIKGNVMDMAVGVIIGGAFGKIVTSLVNDIIMPIVGQFLGGVDFTKLKYVFTPAVEEVKNEAGEIIIPAVEEVALNYGMFIQNVFDFLVIAICIFIMVKGINSLKKEKPEEETGPTSEELLSEIRDLLKNQK